ncbi:MAG: BrnT family toxin [Chloroflexi bacterium]|nr:BrnT family toxin [Chloroflexota bacterium]
MDITRVDILDVDKLERKHNVRVQEVFEVMQNNPRIRFLEKGQHPSEDVYVAYGRAGSGRYVVVFFIYKLSRVALVSSAREMEQKERRQYGRK